MSVDLRSELTAFPHRKGIRTGQERVQEWDEHTETCKGQLVQASDDVFKLECGDCHVRFDKLDVAFMSIRLTGEHKLPPPPQYTFEDWEQAHFAAMASMSEQDREEALRLKATFWKPYAHDYGAEPPVWTAPIHKQQETIEVEGKGTVRLWQGGGFILSQEKEALHRAHDHWVQEYYVAHPAPKWSMSQDIRGGEEHNSWYKEFTAADREWWREHGG